MIRTVRRGGPEFPALLREIPDPPASLFMAGRVLEGGPFIAVVGARRACRYGLEAARWLGAELAGAGITVVSGMARGIDAAAHLGALAGGGTTVAVMGCGLDICYPAGNRALFERIGQCGTLISEHPLGAPPLARHFPVRNRIIAGMSLGVVVVEGLVRGGAMITARLAMEYGREVFAVPGPVHSPGSTGPHLLVRDGARLAASADQILQDLELARPSHPAQPPAALHPDEVRLMDVLEAHPQLLDLIAARARMPASTVTAVLMRLEMKNLVTRHSGGRYARSVGGMPG